MGHPLAFWFAMGVGLVGFVNLVLPGLADETAVSVLLPDWLERVFATVYMVSGFSSVYGITLGKPRWEALGMAMLSSGVLANFIILVDLRPNNAATATFLLTLAIGCGQRAFHLSRRGYTI